MPRIERRRPAADAERWRWPENVHPVLRQVLSRRAIESPEELDLELKHLVPVGRFDALTAAVELLLQHRERHIVIVGDFDADGATSAALGVLTLEKLGFAQVSYFIPDRFEHGYGLSPEVVQSLVRLQPTLIVTVDNGISSIDGVSAAREAGFDVLITDHHLPPSALPNANVIVNPNLPGDDFPGKQLAGVGVVFYLMAALGQALGQPRCVTEYLDLVALGTVADLVVLDRLNRILVDQGLRRIRAGNCRAGVRALCRAAGQSFSEVRGSTLGYQIAPRLNAAGRLHDMSVGVRCLLSDSEAEAEALAGQLDGLNRDRRELEARMKAEALALMDDVRVTDDGELSNVICLLRRDWHEGLVGLIASRIKERYYRPTFAFALTESGGLKGSGRSIAGFHLRDALAEVDARHPGLIERFGGHAMAAGLSLHADAFARFEQAIEEVGGRRLSSEQLAERILTDGELAPSDMSLEVAALLRDAGPWGQGFPEPSFDGRFELVDRRVLKDAHLKMKLKPRSGPSVVDAIAFNCPSLDWAVGSELQIVYRLTVNDYFSTPKPQLIVDFIDPIHGLSTVSTDRS